MNNTTKKITETAMWIATAVVLDFLPLYKMPNGGSASLVMLPLFFMIYRLDFKYGILGTIGYGFINFLLDGAAYGLWSLILDYFVAFGVLTFSSIFKKKVNQGNIILFETGIFIGAFLRYVVHGIAGMILWESTFEYSFIIYNLPYMGISTLLCLIVGIFVYIPLFPKSKEFIKKFKK